MQTSRDTSKTLILVTATEFVMNWIELYVHCLNRQNKPDSFQLVVLTFPGSFSKLAKARLRQLDVQLFEHEMDALKINNFPAAHGETLDVYRLKHLGKAYLADLFLSSTTVVEYDAVILSDLDIILQASLSEFREKIIPGRIMAAQEYYPLSTQPFLIQKLNRALDFQRYKDLKLDISRHEINFGFLFSDIPTASFFMKSLLELILAPDLADLLEADSGDIIAYHEQDFMRLFLQATSYKGVELVGYDTLIHLCHIPGHQQVDCLYPVSEKELEGRFVYPAAVHFAGGVWPSFPEIQDYLDGYSLAGRNYDPGEHLGGLRIAFDSLGVCRKVVDTGDMTILQKAIYALESGRFSEASQFYGILLDRQPDNLDASFGMGVSQVRSGKMDQGLQYLQSVFAICPEAIARKRKAAEILESAALLKEALELWRDVQDLLPEQPIWIVPITRITLSLEGLEVATKQFDVIMREIPGILDTGRLGQCLELLGRTEASIALYENRLSIRPDDRGVRILLVYLLQKTGDHERCYHHLEILVEDSYETSFRLQWLYCHYLRRFSQNDKAMVAFRNLYESHSQEIQQNPYNNGCIYKTLGLFDEAMELFDLVHPSHSDYYGAQFLLEGCRAQLGRQAMKSGNKELAEYHWEKSLNKLERLLDLRPSDSNVLVCLCDINRYLGRFEKAMSFAEKLCSCDPETAEAKKKTVLEHIDRDPRSKSHSSVSHASDKILKFKDCHRRQRAFIIGNGPSLQINDLDRLHHEVTFASNKIYLAFDSTQWRPTYYTVLDMVVAQNIRTRIKEIRQTKIFPTDVKAYVDNDDDISWIQGIPNKRDGEEILFDFSTDLQVGVYGGWSVIFTQLQIAYYMGLSEIYLIGIDFHFEMPAPSGENCHQGPILIQGEERNHFHPDYRPAGEKWTMPRLDLQHKAFLSAKHAFDASGRKVYNASRQTKLDVFDRVDFDALF